MVAKPKFHQNVNKNKTTKDKIFKYIHLIIIQWKEIICIIGIVFFVARYRLNNRAIALLTL